MERKTNTYSPLIPTSTLVWVSSGALGAIGGIAVTKYTLDGPTKDKQRREGMYNKASGIEERADLARDFSQELGGNPKLEALAVKYDNQAAEVRAKAPNPNWLAAKGELVLGFWAPPVLIATLYSALKARRNHKARKN